MDYPSPGNLPLAGPGCNARERFLRKEWFERLRSDLWGYTVSSVTTPGD
jgi:hypothetical protein